MDSFPAGGEAVLSGKPVRGTRPLHFESHTQATLWLAQVPIFLGQKKMKTDGLLSRGRRSRPVGKAGSRHKAASLRVTYASHTVACSSPNFFGTKKNEN